MARSKTYQMLMKISGDSSSLKKACEAASEHLDTLGNAAKAAGKVAATALAGIGTAAAGDCRCRHLRLYRTRKSGQQSGGSHRSHGERTGKPPKRHGNRVPK